MSATQRVFIVALAACLTTAVATAEPGDDFFLLDNGGGYVSVDGLYRSNTDDVSGDVLVREYESLLFWADLAPADQLFHLFAARPGSDPAIVRIRESDGEIVSEITLDQSLRSIGFDASSGVLYAFNQDTNDSRLFTVDLETGETSLVGDTGIPNLTVALVFDPVTAWLYSTNSDGDLYAIDAADASATLIGSTGLDFPFGLAWNPSDGLLYVTDELTDSLYIIDRADASTMLVGGPYTLALFATGLSFSNVPEPATALLLVLGGLLGRFARSR